MFDNSNDLVFAEDVIVFANEEENIEEIKDSWKLLVVDDELEVHSVTKMVLGKFEFEGKKLELLSAFSGAEARALVRENPDLAVILLDVVMEEDDTGLKMIKYIREELKNSMVRIILRTGQPGQAPEERVVIDYDINDYKEKTELTSRKLYTAVVSALRAYRDLNTIDNGRKGLKGIVDTFSEVFFQQPFKVFSSKVLSRLTDIIELSNNYKRDSSSFAAVKKNEDFFILSATGKYHKNEDERIQDAVDEVILKYLYEAYAGKKNIYNENSIIIYLKGMTGSESLIYFEGYVRLNDLTKELIEVFCSNVSAVNEAIISSNKYETERQQRALSEKLRDLVRDLASTLDLNGVLIKLLKNLEQAVDYTRGLAVLTEKGNYRILSLKEDGCIKAADCVLEEFECEIVDEVAKSGLPYLASGLNILSFEQNIWLQSCLAVPINHQGELYGVIMLQDPKPNAFNTRDENVALTFAGQAGLAIENACLFYQVTKRNSDIKNLLDNAGQGFMTFGEDLQVDAEYSAECVNIFGCAIEGVKFPGLVYQDVEQQKYLEIMMRKVLSIQSLETREIYIPLLPGEICVNGKHIDIKYKILDNPEESDSRLFMVILTDMSDRKHLENKMEKERNTLKMVVKAVTDYEDLVKCIRDYREFCKREIFEIIAGNGCVENIVFEIMRKVHTFKGSFSQLDLINIVDKLHEFETELSGLRKYEARQVLEELESRIKTYDMLSWLQSDLEVLEGILGEEYLKHEKIIFVDQRKLMEIEKRIESSMTSFDGRQLLAELRQLRYKPFREIFKQYPDYVEKLAIRMNKLVNPLVIEGGDFLVDITKYEDFARSLIHVFRNAVDHGVETPDQRIHNNKCECADISCKVGVDGGKICIEISDDGNGICIEKLRNAAVNQGIMNMDTAYALDETELIGLVFKEFFTTRTDIDEYSGRGVGLAAVMNEVEKIGGKAEVRTKKGQGTSFIFTLKYEV